MVVYDDGFVYLPYAFGDRVRDAMLLWPNARSAAQVRSAREAHACFELTELASAWAGQVRPEIF